MMEAIAKELRVGVDNSEAVLHGKLIERLWGKRVDKGVLSDGKSERVFR
jgi:hypothetical protein